MSGPQYGPGLVESWLYGAKTTTEQVDAQVGPPGWLFHKVSDPMDGGAIISPDPVGGLSGKIYAGLTDAKQTAEGNSSQNALQADLNYAKCPQGV